MKKILWAIVFSSLAISSFTPAAKAESYNEYVISQMAEICGDIITNVNELRGYTDYRMYGQYLLPIRKAAASCVAVASARGDMSRKAQAYYYALLYKMDRAAPYMDNAFEVDYAMQLAIDLMHTRETIRRLLE